MSSQIELNFNNNACDNTDDIENAKRTQSGYRIVTSPNGFTFRVKSIDTSNSSGDIGENRTFYVQEH